MPTFDARVTCLAVHELLQAVAPHQRTCWYLVRVCGLTAPEAARLMDYSPHYARQMVRETQIYLTTNLPAHDALCRPRASTA